MITRVNIKDVLMQGGTCILPTETVYGLAARADNTKAIDRIYSIKGRNFDKPLAVCISDIEYAETLAEFNSQAKALADAFWPGPLTLVLPAKDKTLDARCYQNDMIALRCPDIAWREHLLDKPLALTSANRSGEPDAITANTEINTEVDGLLDMGPAKGGTPSTIISVSKTALKGLRLGALTKDELARFDIDWP